MRLICRFVGHTIAHDLIMRDSYTFIQQTYCKRCGTPLERADGEHWGPPKPVDPRPRPARSDLPPLAHPVDEDHVTAEPVHRYSSRECREAYRRGARELYERSIGERGAPNQPELAEWLDQLDSWQGGDPPPMPDTAHIRALESAPPLTETSAGSAPDAEREDALQTATAGTTDLVFRVRVELMTEPAIAAAVANQPTTSNSVAEETAEAHEGAGQIVQLSIKR